MWTIKWNQEVKKNHKKVTHLKKLINKVLTSYKNLN